MLRSNIFMLAYSLEVRECKEKHLKIHAPFYDDDDDLDV